MEVKLGLEFLRVVEEAAIAAARTMGQGDRHHADDVAVEAMRRVMDTVPMDGTIVIGEGERDEAPMLCIGEKVGAARGKPNSGFPAVDIAVDPLEEPTCARPARPTPLPCWRPANAAACSTRPIFTWRRLLSAPPAKARWISTRQSPTISARLRGASTATSKTWW